MNQNPKQTRTTMVADIDLADLRAKAEAATPGEWLDHTRDDVSTDDPMMCGWDGRGAHYWCAGPDSTQEQAERDGVFIAAANPAVVLSLLDRLAAAEADYAAGYARALSDVRASNVAEPLSWRCYVRDICDALAARRTATEAEKTT